ncbi:MULTISPECIES: hypothetical protein [unclassified Bradyrhizobium]|uniref:hypothetical protein n=1 Tax=unclassified Bradyrhizobium TaxID=2631580 RepID=UPI002FF221CD
MDGYLTSASNCDRTPQMCVILTLAAVFPQFEPYLRHCLPAGGNQRCQEAAPEGVGNQMTKESTPLWVWLAVGLLAIGTVAYVTAVFLIEYIMALF